MNCPLTIEQMQQLRDSLNDVVGYLTDNSCSDPECCGGPYYTDHDYVSGLQVMGWYGLKAKE